MPSFMSRVSGNLCPGGDVSVFHHGQTTAEPVGYLCLAGRVGELGTDNPAAARMSGRGAVAPSEGAGEGPAPSLCPPDPWALNRPSSAKFVRHVCATCYVRSRDPAATQNASLRVSSSRESAICRFDGVTLPATVTRQQSQIIAPRNRPGTAACPQSRLRCPEHGPPSHQSLLVSRRTLLPRAIPRASCHIVGETCG